MPDESAIRLKLVMAVGAMGLTPMSPVMSEEGKVEMPDLVRMTKSPGLEVLLEVLIRCEVVPASRCCQPMSEAWGGRRRRRRSRE